MTGRPNRPHHTGNYARRAANLRRTAHANPETICWRCGQTLEQYAAMHGIKAAMWQAGHTKDGQVGGQLLPEHARCNAQAGAIARNKPPTSEDW
jgi:hypothetical protein